MQLDKTKVSNNHLSLHWSKQNQKFHCKVRLLSADSKMCTNMKIFSDKRDLLVKPWALQKNFEVVFVVTVERVCSQPPLPASKQKNHLSIKQKCSTCFVSLVCLIPSQNYKRYIWFIITYYNVRKLPPHSSSYCCGFHHHCYPPHLQHCVFDYMTQGLPEKTHHGQ